VARKHGLTIIITTADDYQREATRIAAARCTVGARRAAKCKQASKQVEGQGAAGYRNGAKNDGSSCMPENPLGLGGDEEC
jgi:hypothetical protein